MSSASSRRPDRAARTARWVILWLALALTAVLPYLPSLRFGFVWDDQELIVNNERLETGSIPSVFTRGFMPMHEDSLTSHGKYYRPLVNLNLMIDRHRHGLDPFWYHLHNVVLNAAATLAFALLVYALLHSFWAVLAAGALFALHPAHTESVAFISGRTDILMAVFAFACLLCMIYYLRTGRKWLIPAAAICYLLALLAKETALLVPFAALALPASRIERRSGWVLSASLGAAALAYFVLRVMALGGSSPVIIKLPVWQYPVMVLNVLGTYLSILVFPFHPRLLMAQTPAIGQPSFLTSLGLILIVAPLLLARVVRRQRGPLLAGFFLLLASLLPVTNILSLGMAYAAERLVYLPSAGFLIIVTALGSWLVSSRSSFRYAIAGVCAVYLVAMAVNLEQRLPAWRDQPSLFRAMTRSQPNSAYAEQNLGITLLDDYGQSDSAAFHFRRAISLAPALSDPHANLARALQARSDTTGAIHEYQLALGLSPDDFEAHNNLGKLWGQHGNQDSAIAQLQAAIRLKPERAEAHSNLGIAYAISGRNQEALTEFRQALRLKPDLRETYRNLAALFGALGLRDSARYYTDQERRLPAAPAQRGR